jgi:ABC-type glycerol-3-phosphate transport system substrate-binding protein
MRDPSVSRFVKKTLGFTENDLLDPEKNVDAKIALMRTRTGDHAKFVKTTDPQKATEDFMKMFSRPTDTSDAAVNKRIGNLTAVNKLIGDTINQGSRELADANRPAAVEKNPVIVNNNNTNVTKTAAPTQPIPNAFNVEISELLFGQLVRGM